MTLEEAKKFLIPNPTPDMAISGLGSGEWDALSKAAPRVDFSKDSFSDVELEAMGYESREKAPQYISLDEDENKRKKVNLAIAGEAARRIMEVDVENTDKARLEGIYRMATKAVFGLDDETGRVLVPANNGNVASNIASLRRFFSGDYSAIETPEETEWRKLLESKATDEEIYRFADAHLHEEGKDRSGRAPGFFEKAFFAGAFNDDTGTTRENATAVFEDVMRRGDYEKLADEEKAAWRRKTVDEYRKQLAVKSPLAAFLKLTGGLSDLGKKVVADAVNSGAIDKDALTQLWDADRKQAQKALSAISTVRGDQKKGRLLGISTDFTDDTPLNRLQLALYGFQQSVVGLGADVADVARSGWKYGVAKYYKAIGDEEAYREYVRDWDIDSQIDLALEQNLPDADGFFGRMVQGVAENAHWFIPYGAIAKGGKAVKAAKEAGKAVKTIEAAAAGAAKSAKFARTLQGRALAKGEVAAVVRYTKKLQELNERGAALDKALEAAGSAASKAGRSARVWRPLGWAGRISAYSAFADEYMATADAAGISRVESVPTAAFVGAVNAAVENLYVPFLESGLSPAEVKSLMLSSLKNAWDASGRKGLSKWLGNYAATGLREGAKVYATEGLVEEELQQIVTETGKQIDKRAQKLRERGEGGKAEALSQFWGEVCANPEYAFDRALKIYMDTAAEVAPSSAGFGILTLGQQKMRQHLHNVAERRRSGDENYDAGVLDMLSRRMAGEKAIAECWERTDAAAEKRGEKPQKRAPNATSAALSAARDAVRNLAPGENAALAIADAAQVDVKTAEVLSELVKSEEEWKLYSPRFRAAVNLSDYVQSLDESRIREFLPEYVEGSFLADESKGIYSVKTKIGDAEKTIVYRVGAFDELMSPERIAEAVKDGSVFARSWETRRKEQPGMKAWTELGAQERERYVREETNGFINGDSGVFEFKTASGETLTVNADDVVNLVGGNAADVGYRGARATYATARHETFHALWRFAKDTLPKEDLDALYSHFQDLDRAADEKAGGAGLDEAMAHEFEKYASGNYVSPRLSGRFDAVVDRIMKSLGGMQKMLRMGQADSVGREYSLEGFYRDVLAGKLGTGALGVEMRKIAAPAAQEGAKSAEQNPPRMNPAPDAGKKESPSAAQNPAGETAAPPKQESAPPVESAPQAQEESQVPAATLENPAASNVPGQKFYRLQAGDGVWIVGELVVDDVSNLHTSDKGDLSDMSLQNRMSGKERESRILKIAANPNPRLMGTVNEQANGGFIWSRPNGDVFIGNTRVSGATLAYENGTAGELSAYMIREADERGIEIPEGVSRPLVHFVLHRIESADGKATIHDVIRATNESTVTEMTALEKATNDADAIDKAGIASDFAFRADGRIDETKSADAIRGFFEATHAVGLVDDNTDMLTKEGGERIFNALLAHFLKGADAATVEKAIGRTGALDMRNEMSALVQSAPALETIADVKPRFDVRDAIAEILPYYMEWLEKDVSKRVEAGKTRKEWYEKNADGSRKRGVSWAQFMSQGDMFRTPSPAARIVGDLLAASRDLRSFDKEDAESDAGKARAQKLVKDYFEDYAQNAAVAPDETDMFGTPPPTREEMMRHFRENGRDAGPRFSVNPNLRADIDAALNTDPAKGTVVKGGKRVVFGRSQRLFPALGLPDGDIYSKAYALRKIANDHNLTAEQLAAAPSLMEEPAAVFDDNGNGYVFLTDAIASDEDGKDAPVMFYIRPDGEGNYIASAYARKERAESKYVNLVNAGMVRYWDKSKIARLPLRGEAQSSLITFSAGDSVVTPEGLTPQSVSQTGAPAQGARYSIAGRGGAANLGLKGAAEAEAMEKAGADREDIWRTTGWWRARDGKWRVEIPDAKRLGFKGDLRTRHFDGHTSFRLNELVYADALEKAYPEMFGDGSGMVLIHVNDDTGFTAAYSPSSDTIEIPRNMLITGKYADGKDWAHLSESGLSMVVHEIQHAIQKREGFATGADGRQTDYDTYRRTTGEVEARNVQTRLGMTAEERAATPPWKTEDVAEASQIVRYSVAAPLVEAMRNRQRYSVGGIFTGTAADYANRSRQGGVDDGQMRYSIAQASSGEKFVLLDRPNRIDWNDRDKVREYLATLVGTGAVSLADGERIEIGKELPDEYTRSRYAEKSFRNVRLRKVRGKTAQHLDELIAVSGERTAEPSKHKKREGGVYYRRVVNFGVFGHEVRRGYSAELVSYEENGREYLYDLVNIKDNPSLVPDSATGGNGGFKVLSTYNGEGSTPQSVSQTGGRAQGGGFRASTGGIQEQTPYPNLAMMSDDEVLVAALAVRIAGMKHPEAEIRGGAGRRTTYAFLRISTVKKYLQRIHPGMSDDKLASLVDSTARKARKLALRMREDLARGVSESAIVRYLPENMRDTFGEEMKAQAGRGSRFGRFGAKAEAALANRQAEILAQAVKVQTGLEFDEMENAYGIDLSLTLQSLAENTFAKPPSRGAADGAAAAAQPADDTVYEDGDSAAARGPAEVSGAVKSAVDEIVSATGEQAEKDLAEREKQRKAAKKRSDESSGTGEGSASSAEAADASGGAAADPVATAVKKAKIDLRNPRHLALFVVELARRHWNATHNLAKDADPWGNAIAMQFLRKTAQSVYSKLAKDLCYSGTREHTMKTIDAFGNIPTVEQLVSEMEYTGALVNARRISETAFEMCKKLKRMLEVSFGATGRFRPDNEELRRRVPAEMELRARYMKKVMWMTPDGCAKEAGRLAARLAAAESEFAEENADVHQSMVYAETMRDMAILREFGGLRWKRPGEIEQAIQWWMDAAEGGAREICDAWTAREERTTRLAGVFAAAFRNPKLRKAAERSFSQTFGDFFHAHSGFSHLLRDLMRFAGDKEREEAERALEWLELEIQKAGTRVMSERTAMQKEFRDAVESIYHAEYGKVMRMMMEEDGSFAKFMGEADDGIKVVSTRARALQLYSSLVQLGRKIEVPDPDDPGRTKTVYDGGYWENIVENGREGQAEELAKLLTPEDMNLLAWMRKWYERNRAGLSRTSENLFGVGIYAETGNYMPAKMRLDPQDLEKPSGGGYAFFPKSLTPRIRNKRDFDTSADIFLMWGGRMEEAAQWKAHAELGLELRGIFGRSELQKAIRASHGDRALRDVKGFITDILTGRGVADTSADGAKTFLDSVRGWTAVAALGGNVGVMLKQITSIPAFGFEIGIRNTFKYLASAFTPEGMAAMRTLWNSEERKNRWNGGNDESVSNALNVSNPGLIKRMLLKTMVTNKMGDVVPSLVIGQGIFRDALDRGMSKEDALAYTWMLAERTQQSSRIENRAAFQRRGKLGNAIYQFLSTQQQYLQYEVRAIREVFANPRSGKRWKALARAATLNHILLYAAYTGMGILYNALLGQEPPEDKLADWVAGALTGPYGALFGIGLVTEDAINEAMKPGSTYIRGGARVTSLDFVLREFSDVSRLLHDSWDAATGGRKTWDDVLEDLGKGISSSNAIFRDLRKIYRFRIKGEPQKK